MQQEIGRCSGNFNIWLKSVTFIIGSSMMVWFVYFLSKTNLSPLSEGFLFFYFNVLDRYEFIKWPSFGHLSAIIRPSIGHHSSIYEPETSIFNMYIYGTTGSILSRILTGFWVISFKNHFDTIILCSLYFYPIKNQHSRNN